VALGLPDTVLGAAWPAMHGDFGVSLGALGVLGVTGALAAVASSVTYGWLKTKPPPWLVLVGSVALMAASMLAFGLTSTWWVAIALCVAWGLCGGGIDIQLNHFAARHFSPKHMNWLHGCWGIGAATGPLLVAGALAWTGHWRAGFWMLAAIMASLGLAFWLTRGLWPAPESPAAQPVDAASGAPPVVETKPPAAAVWLSPISFFLVVAAEFATAIWIPSIMADGHGLPAAEASQWATLFFGAMMVGRFAIGAFSERIGNRRQVRLGIGAAMVGAVVFQACGATAWGALGLAVMGLGSAPLFPGLMHETTVRFSDAWAQRMVARQMTGAYLAGALMPLAYALLVDRVGVWAIIPTAIGLQALLFVCTVALDRATPPLKPAR
jgi:fucose permease